MKRFLMGVVALAVLAWVPIASAGGWSSGVSFTNQVASSPTKGGGYPIAAGQTAPQPGTCRLGDYNSNRSESWLAVEPGTENLVGASKFFFEKYSTFYDFHLGAYTLPNGQPAGNVQIPRMRDSTSIIRSPAPKGSRGVVVPAHQRLPQLIGFCYGNDVTLCLC